MRRVSSSPIPHLRDTCFGALILCTGTELGAGYHGGDQDPAPVLALLMEPSAGDGLALGKSGQRDLSRARQRTIQGAEAIHRRKTMNSSGGALVWKASRRNRYLIWGLEGKIEEFAG